MLAALLVLLQDAHAPEGPGGARAPGAPGGARAPEVRGGARAPDAQVGAPAPYEPKIAPASDEGKVACARIQVPAGFQVDLFAAEPLVANPVCIYPWWKEGKPGFLVAETFRHHKGVTDIRDHMDWLDEDVAARRVEDRVAMYRKHTGDKFSAEFEVEHERVRFVRAVGSPAVAGSSAAVGSPAKVGGPVVADTSIVFADGFKTPATGIGAGLLEHDGDVYYTCIPDLWKLADRDGDGKAEVRELLSTGYGLHVALLGHDLHGLRIGPDGKLYFSCGDRALHVETKQGLVENWKSGSVLRCELDGSGLEIYATGLRNPQDLVFDAYGNLFTGDNNSDGGDSARWVQVIQGGDSGWRYSYQWLVDPVLRGPWNDEKLWYPHFEGQAAYIVPPIADFSHGPSGCCMYPGTGFGEDWNGRFFLCDFEGTVGFSGVDSFRLAPKGASFELVDAEHFAWRLCATDCDFAPDGAMYLSDWTEGWEAPGKGRIFRVASTAHGSDPIVAEVERFLVEGPGKRTVPELARLLAHTDQRVRQSAHLELARRGREGLAALEKVALIPESTLAAIHAIWGLGVIASQDPTASRDSLLDMLGSADPEVRAQCARVLGDLREPRASAGLVRRLEDASPRVRLFAAIALGRLADPAAVEPLFALVRESGEKDATLRAGAILGLAGCASNERCLAAAKDDSVDARLAAVVVLRRRADARVAGFLADPSPLVRLEAARAIYDEPIESAMPALADLLGADSAAEHGPGRGDGGVDHRAKREDGGVDHRARREDGAVDHRPGREDGAVEHGPGHENGVVEHGPGRGDGVVEHGSGRADGVVEHHLGRRALAAAYALGGEDRARLLARFAVDPRQEEALRSEALSHLARWKEPGGRDPFLGEWRPRSAHAGPFLPAIVASIAEPLLRESEEECAPASVAASFVRLAGEVGASDLAARFTRIARDEARPPTLRAAALGSLGKLEPADLESTLSSTLFDADGSVRAASLRAYQSVFPGQAIPLLETALSAETIEERRVALQGLAKVADPDADDLLRAQFEKQGLGLFPAELALDLTVAAEARESPKLKAILDLRSETRKAADPALASYLDCLFGGDAASGKRVFRENSSLACLRCHKISGDPDTAQGGVVGPDLAGVGHRLSRLQLLESILDPNRSLARGYEGVVFTMSDDAYVEGSIVSENPEFVRVRKADGTTADLATAQIAARKKGLSAMPEGMKQYVSREHVRDLLEFLGRL